jgi:predicted ribosome quality control (RQC) complex YloA/Tae2 family protein
MSLHAAEMAPLVAWLDDRLRGATLQGARMPDRDTLVLSARQPGETIHLLLSWGPDLARVHTVDRPPKNPATPPAFQGLLRKELQGRIASIELVGGDRVVHVRADRGEERIGLVIEATGRRGNAFLLGPDGRIRGTARHTDDEPRGPGQPWRAPDGGGHPGEDRFPGPPEERDAAVRGFFEAAAEEHRLGDDRRRLLSILRSRRKQLRRLVGKQEVEAGRADEAGLLREEGDLLRTAFGRMRRGMDAVEVQDWTTGQARTIALDPALDPREQVDRRYARARKVERAGVEAGERLERSAAELAEVEALIELAEEDVEAAMELLPPPLRRRMSQPLPSRRQTEGPRVPYRSFWWRDVELRVGRGARDNDALTFHHARGNEIWMHVRGRPGAHVVLRFRDEAPPLELLLAGAQLALAGSKVQDGDRAEVAWTRVKDVKKPKGLPPGKVLVSNERVLLVEADLRARAALATEPPG